MSRYGTESSDTTRDEHMKSINLLVEMQHEHYSSERDHHAQDAHASPGYQLPRAEIQLLMPLVRRGDWVDHELRVWNDHLERSDVVARCAGKQVFDELFVRLSPKNAYSVISTWYDICGSCGTCAADRRPDLSKMVYL